MITSHLEIIGVQISRSALEKRISMLRRAGYINSRRYARTRKHGHIALYSITQKALAVLTATGYPIEQIRMGLPIDYMALHELLVTQTLHAIMSEVSRNIYKCTFLDAAIMKQLREKGSREPIPDLRLELRFLDGRETTINIEVDMGTILAVKMAKRLANLSNRKETIIMLCHSQVRIAHMRKACETIYINHSEVVFFALQDDFQQNGFQDTKLICIDGKIYYLTINENGE